MSKLDIFEYLYRYTFMQGASQVLVNHSKHSKYFPQKNSCQNDHHIQFKSQWWQAWVLSLCLTEKKEIHCGVTSICLCKIVEAWFFCHFCSWNVLTIVSFKKIHISWMSWISSFLKTSSHCYHNKCAWLVQNFIIAVNGLVIKCPFQTPSL